MITINGKDYEINLDIRWGTQKIMRKIQADVNSLDNEKYVEYIIKDLLIPAPSMKDMANFRQSDIEKIFSEFGKSAEGKSKELKKKLSS